MKKLFTKNDVRQATGRFIVGSFGPDNRLSFAPNPALHESSINARAECNRLADNDPNRIYVFVEIKGGTERVVTPQYSPF